MTHEASRAARTVSRINWDGVPDFQTSFWRAVQQQAVAMIEEAAQQQEDHMTDVAQLPKLADSNDVAVKEKTYQADTLQLLWDQYQENKQKIKDLELWNKTLEGQLAILSDNAAVYTIGGKEIATHRRDGQFVKTVFAKEQPGLWAEFTTLQYVKQFDEAAFRAQHPDLHAMYRAQRFVPKS